MGDLETKLATELDTMDLRLKDLVESGRDLSERFNKLGDRVAKNFNWREIVGIRHKARMEGVQLPLDSEEHERDADFEDPNGIKSWVHLMKHLFTSPFIKIGQL